MAKHATLSWKALATTGGILMGLYLGTAAWLANAGIQTMWFSAEMFNLLASIYPGLVAGAVIYGLIIGAICGAICGGVIAWLYNTSSKWFK